MVQSRAACATGGGMDGVELGIRDAVLLVFDGGGGGGDSLGGAARGCTCNNGCAGTDTEGRYLIPLDLPLVIPARA